LVGGIVLIIIGIRTFHSHNTPQPPPNGINSHARTFISTFLLTLTNPMTLFAFAAVFASIGLNNVIGNTAHAALFVAGIFAGSLLWFSLLTTLVHFCRDRVTSSGMAVINRIAGVLLFLFGIVALWSALSSFYFS
jgi:threonine/homoserine/homoserine lactone efflux protein